MPVPDALLALLTLGPAYGLQLVAELGRRTGGAEELGDAQVYTTLGRLERDGLVRPAAGPDDGRQRYALTAAGRARAIAWLGDPRVAAGARDELVLKTALAATLPAGDVRGLVAARRALLGEERAALAAASRDPLARLADSRQRHRIDAELGWLDDVERILREVRPFGLAPAPRRGRRPRTAARPG